MSYKQTSSRMSGNWRGSSEARAAHQRLAVEVDWRRRETAFLSEIKRLRHEVGLQTKRYNWAKMQISDLVVRLQAHPSPPIPERIMRKGTETEGGEYEKDGGQEDEAVEDVVGVEEKEEEEEEENQPPLPPVLPASLAPQPASNQASATPAITTTTSHAGEKVTAKQASITHTHPATAPKPPNQTRLDTLKPEAETTSPRHEVLETTSAYEWGNMEDKFDREGGGLYRRILARVEINGEKMVAWEVGTNGQLLWKDKDEQIARYAAFMHDTLLLKPKINKGNKGYIWEHKVVEGSCWDYREVPQGEHVIRIWDGTKFVLAKEGQSRYSAP